MDIEYIILYYDDCTKTHKIPLITKNLDEWDEVKIRSYQIDPASISMIIIGPKTTHTIYNGPNFDEQEYTIVNDTKDDFKI
jgi:hypothetical protein